MLIYVDGKVHDASKKNVAILLIGPDKENILNMDADCNCYLAGPTLDEKVANEMAAELKKVNDENCNKTRTQE